MPDDLASRNLGRLGSAALGVVQTSQRVRRDNAGAKGKIPSQRESLRTIAAACTWTKVFGTPEGVVPACLRLRPAKGEEVRCKGRAAGGAGWRNRVSMGVCRVGRVFRSIIYCHA